MKPMRIIDGDMLIRKYIDTDIEKFRNTDVKIVLENLKQNILNMPTIETSTWIPCSERLPKEWEHVLVMTDTPYTFNKIRIDWNVDNYWANYGHHVIAWMPLPEPWKGADDD